MRAAPTALSAPTPDGDPHPGHPSHSNEDSSGMGTSRRKRSLKHINLPSPCQSLNYDEDSMDVEVPRATAGALDPDSMSYLVESRSRDDSSRYVCSTAYPGVYLIPVFKCTPAATKTTKIVFQLSRGPGPCKFIPR